MLGDAGDVNLQKCLWSLCCHLTSIKEARSIKAKVIDPFCILMQEGVEIKVLEDVHTIVARWSGELEILYIKLF